MRACAAGIEMKYRVNDVRFMMKDVQFWARDSWYMSIGYGGTAKGPSEVDASPADHDTLEA